MHNVSTIEVNVLISGTSYSNYPVFFLAALLLVAPLASAAGTHEVRIIRYAEDGVTILGQEIVDFQWMEANLPVHGEGVTHYYHQGPVFNDSIADKWNPDENDTAILTKDFGAVKGTDLKDLCDLAGGMQDDDYNVTLRASDGFLKVFAYSSIYTPPSRTGPIVITWYKAGEGYVNQSYDTGMRNVMFADTSTNPWGHHVFGLWDMHEAYPESNWYYFNYPGQPSTTGLSVQNIDRILIYTNDPPAPVASFGANTTKGPAPLSVQFTDLSAGGSITGWAWDFENDGTPDSFEQNPSFTYNLAGNYTVNLSVTNPVGMDDEVKTGFITVTAPAIRQYAVFRPSSSNWIFTENLTGVKYRDRYGVATDLPLAADFNNDGLMDRAVFRNGQWIVDWNMDGTVDCRTYFGISTDIPLAADFNNDGLMDRAVFRNGQWIMDWNMDGTVDCRTYFGISTDIPLAADFNNDGLMDRAVFRNGQWIVDWNMDGSVDSRTGYGIQTDIPLVGLLNSDSVMDRAVFRNGQWIFDHGGDGSVNRRSYFGIADDRPLSW